jgi:hypothetical protein
MYKTIVDIKSIKFPVYKLENLDVTIVDGIVFTDQGKVLDDRNMPGTTIGIRRLQSQRQDLKMLKMLANDEKSLLNSRGSPCLIDSEGNIFQYVKTRNEKLKYYLIEKVDKQGTFSLIKLQGIKTPFKVPRPPYPEFTWARVLHYKSLPWIIYDYDQFKGKDSIKRV